MTRNRMICVLAVVVCLALAGTALAHTPICAAYLNGDGTVTCEGGFSDGSSAEGVKMTVKTLEGKVLVEGAMDEFSEFTFEKPEVPFEIEFDAGPGHTVIIKGETIE